MSQVKFFTELNGKHVEVMGGWDRPCSHYHLAVFDEEEEPLWTSLYTYEGGGSPEAAPLLDKLVELGIEIPEGFEERFCRQEGNVTYLLRANGWERYES